MSHSFVELAFSAVMMLLAVGSAFVHGLVGRRRESKAVNMLAFRERCLMSADWRDALKTARVWVWSPPAEQEEDGAGLTLLILTVLTLHILRTLLTLLTLLILLVLPNLLVAVVVLSEVDSGGASSCAALRELAPEFPGRSRTASLLLPSLIDDMIG